MNEYGWWLRCDIIYFLFIIIIVCWYVINRFFYFFCSGGLRLDELDFDGVGYVFFVYCFVCSI